MMPSRRLTLFSSIRKFLTVTLAFLFFFASSNCLIQEYIVLRGNPESATSSETGFPFVYLSITTCLSSGLYLLFFIFIASCGGAKPCIFSYLFSALTKIFCYNKRLTITVFFLIILQIIKKQYRSKKRIMI